MSETVSNEALILEDLKRDEGFRGMPYRCSADKLTVGYGTLLPLTEGEAKLLLQYRLGLMKGELATRLRGEGIDLHELPACVQRALLNASYCLGVPRFMGFTRMLEALLVRDYEDAAKELLDSRFARQVKGRAERLAALIRLGDNPETA